MKKVFSKLAFALAVVLSTSAIGVAQTFYPIPDATVPVGQAYSHSVDVNGFQIQNILIQPSGTWLKAELGSRPRIYGTPQPNDVGSVTYTITVNDGGHKNELTQQVTITVVDGDPIFNSSPPTRVNEGDIYRYQVDVSDPEGSNVTLALTNGPNWLSVNGHTISGNVSFSASGEYPVSITATDVNGNESHQNYKLTVNNTNRSPSISTNPPKSGQEGQQYSYSVSASDPDGDNLSYSMVQGPNWLSFSGQTLSGTPNYNQNGSYDIKIRVTDGNGGSDSQSYTLSISNYNRNPSISSKPPNSAIEGDTYSYVVSASDPDGDNLSYSMVQGPNWLSFSGRTLSGMPNHEAQGEYSIKIRVTDGNGGSDSQSYKLTVSGTNRSPEINSSPPLKGREGQQYSYAVSATNPDRDNLSYSMVEGPNWLSFSGQTLSGTPNYNQNGSYNIKIRVTDGNGGSDSQSYRLEINNYNPPPQITSNPPKSGQEGQQYSYSVSASDADGDNISYSMVQGPNWLSFSGRTLSGTPGYTERGNYTIKIKVSDGKAFDTQRYTLTISKNDKPPRFTSNPDRQVRENSTYNYTMSAQDPNGDKLSFSMVQGPGWLSVNGSQLEGTPGYNDAGSYAIKVKVTAGGLSDTQSFTLEVIDKNDRGPVWQSNPPTGIKENQNYSYTLKAKDPDGTDVTYSIVKAPNWLSITGNELHGKPGYNASGKYEIVLQASSGGDKTNQSFELTVNNINRPPKFISTPIKTVGETKNYVYDMRANDPDGNKLTFSMVQGPGWLSVNGSQLEGIPDSNDEGTYDIVVKVSDGSKSDKQSYTLTVKGQNRPPEFTSTPVTKVSEGKEYSYTVTTSDPDKDPLILEGVKIPGFLKLVNNKNGKATLTGTPDHTTSGTYQIVLSISDGIATVKQKFTLTVSGDNRSPEFVSKPEKFVKAKRTYTYEIDTKDPDGQDINISYVQGPNFLRIKKEDPQKGTAILTGDVPGNKAGEYDIILKASDGSRSSTQRYTLSVTKGNGPPVFTSKPVSGVIAGKKYNYKITTKDNEGNNVTISLESGPDFLKLTGVNPKEGVATLLGQPKVSDKGAYTVILKATDNGNPSTSSLQQFELTVSTSNLAPVITSSPIKSSSIGVKYTYKIVVTDTKDNLKDQLTISVTGGNGKSIPDFLSVQDISNETNKIVKALSGTPDRGDNGTYSVRITAKDNNGGRDVQNYTLTISKGNQKPVFNSSPDVSTMATVPYTYKVTASDPDGDAISLSAGLQGDKPLPDWLSFSSNGDSGTLSGVPSPSDVGRLNIVIKATDNGNPKRLRKQQFALTIDRKSVSSIQVYFVYPTSCREECTIKFGLPSEQYVYMEVFSASGKKVRVTKKKKYHQGINELIFNPRKLPSGQYYFILHGQGISYNANMTIIN